jgi:Tfp pilus assembly protein PilO
MKIKYSQKVLGSFVIIFLLILTANIIIGRMSIKQIESINNKIRQVTLSSEEREKLLALKESLTNSEEDRKLLDKYFIGSTDADTANFISYIENLAKQNGLTYNVQNVSYEPISEISSSEQVNFMKFQLNIVGGWSNIFTFVQNIENLPKVVSLSAVSIDNGPSLGAKSKTKNWSADLEFSVARLKN